MVPQIGSPLELFDVDPQAKEKGSLNVNFRDQIPHFSQKFTFHTPLPRLPELAS